MIITFYKFSWLTVKSSINIIWPLVMRCSASWLLKLLYCFRFARILAHHPYVILVAVAVFASTCMVIPLATRNLPSFGNPQLVSSFISHMPYLVHLSPDFYFMCFLLSKWMKHFNVCLDLGSQRIYVCVYSLLLNWCSHGYYAWSYVFCK